MICATRSCAVALLHVADDLVAPLLAEVDVEVRHRDALGIQEALEQQAEAQRIEVGDGGRVGDQRARAGAAARTDGNVVRLRPLDEVGDDEEVAGILHALDDGELEIEPLVVVSSVNPGAGPWAARRASSPSSAWRRNSAASSTSAPPSPVEKRGRIGLPVRGR